MFYCIKSATKSSKNEVNRCNKRDYSHNVDGRPQFIPGSWEMMRSNQRWNGIVPNQHIRRKYYYAQDEQSHIRSKYFYFCPVLCTDITWIHLENQIPLSNISDRNRPQLIYPTG